MYKVEWSKKSQKNLDKLDRPLKEKIARKVENYLAKSPDKYGKPLKGKWEGKYRYRFGDYRIIYEILYDRVVIWVVDVGNRSGIYD